MEQACKIYVGNKFIKDFNKVFISANKSNCDVKERQQEITNKNSSKAQGEICANRRQMKLQG